MSIGNWRVCMTSEAKRQLLARLKAVRGPRRTADEALAIVGLSCRFAGADSAEQLWRLLAEGTDAISRVPADRWAEDALDALLPPEQARAARWGGFMADVEQFDPQFFAIAPREAPKIDPQHRLLLEQSWHAIEDAGLSTADLAGSRTGVWMAVYHRDHARRAMRARSSPSADSASSRKTRTVLR